VAAAAAAATMTAADAMVRCKTSDERCCLLTSWPVHRCAKMMLQLPLAIGCALQGAGKVGPADVAVHIPC
jgi:hypothetical protein